jgi:hypothetical protein
MATRRIPLHPQPALSVREGTAPIGCHDNQLEQIDRDGFPTVHRMIFHSAPSAIFFRKWNCVGKNI